MNRALIGALLVSLPAIASDFASRIAEAKHRSGELGSFTLVGDVTASGALKAVAFEQQTKVSTCFANQFGKTLLPKPPRMDRDAGFPIVVAMKVAP